MLIIPQIIHHIPWTIHIKISKMISIIPFFNHIHLGCRSGIFQNSVNVILCKTKIFIDHNPKQQAWILTQMCYKILPAALFNRFNVAICFSLQRHFYVLFHHTDLIRYREVRISTCTNILNRIARCQFSQYQSIRCHFKVASFCYDVSNTVCSGEWKGTFLSYLGAAAFITVVSCHNNFLYAGA